MIKRFTWCLMMVMVMAAYTQAQQVTITGTIIDVHSEEPLAFANVFINSDKTVGATTDFDGNYTFSFKRGEGDSIVASVLGYDAQVKEVSSSSNQTINFRLDRARVAIKEVVINPGKNPAHIILKKIIANKKKHDRRKVKAYQTEVYSKVEIDIDGISEKFQNRKLFKPFSFVFDNIDSTSEDDPFLPVFLTESVSNLYYRKNPKAEKEIIIASKASGVQNESFSQFLGSMYADYNVYENWFSVMTKEFVSPIANNGLFYYRYYLVDSAMIDNHWCYKIQFKPKTKSESTFYGELWAHDTTFAIKQISMSVPDHVNINYINKVSIFQEYDYVNDSVWMISKDKLIVNFLKPENAPGAIGRKTTTYRDYIIDNPNINEFFDIKGGDVVVSDDVFEKDDSFWTNARHEKLSKNEAHIYGMIDTIKNLPYVQTWIEIVSTMATGYLVTGPFEIGNFYTFMNVNDVEGFRLKYGMRTSNEFSTDLMVSAYGAYGFKDREWKYGTEFLYLMDKKPRQSISGSFRYDITATASIEENFGSGGLLENFILTRKEDGLRIPQKLLLLQEVRFDYYKEWHKGLSITVGGANRTFDPYFAYQYTNPGDGIVDSNITTTELKLKTRFAHKEKFISGQFNRVSLGSEKPVLSLEYTLGAKDLLHSEYNYHKLELTVTDEFNVGPWGWTEYKLQGGKIFGDVPFLLMKIPAGNEGFFYKENGFNLATEYEFASDAYGIAIIDHHFDGFFFDRVPGVKKLKLRSLISARLMYGTMSQTNKTANYFNLAENPFNKSIVKIKVPDKKPYVEVGAGIENIAKLFRVDVMWRLTHRKPIKGSNFGVRAGLELQF